MLSRHCELCEREFSRKASESNVEWRGRRFCCARCGIAAASIAGSNGGNPISADAQRASDRIATDHLRDSMFRFYRNVASERGLANEWEAAVMLGMAA